MAYNPNNMLFYVSVASASLKAIHVFTTSCAFQRSIGLSYPPFGISIYNNVIYVGYYNNFDSISSNRLAILKDENFYTEYLIFPCYKITAITFDSFNYMAISCENDYKTYLYDRYGYGQALSFTLNDPGYFTAVDSYGRFIIGSLKSVGIYY
jgi:hypothetical protein